MKTLEPLPFDLVYVKWEDSCSPNELGWRPLSEGRSDGRYLCQSVGWAVDGNKYSIKLASHIDHEKKNGLGIIEIPRCAIVKAVVLQKAKK